MATPEERLEAAVRRRDTLDASCRRLEGRLEAARTALAAVEAECREKGVEPDQIDSTIKLLEERFNSLLSQLEKDLGAAETALAPFTKEMK